MLVEFAALLNVAFGTPKMNWIPERETSEAPQTLISVTLCWDVRFSSVRLDSRDSFPEPVRGYLS